MNNNVNRKTKDGKTMNEEEILQETLKKLRQTYNYTDRQITLLKNFDDDYADIAIYLTKNSDIPLIIGEIKEGDFIFPFAEKQLEKLVRISGAKFGFLTNGKEWINYQRLENKIIRTLDIPSQNQQTRNIINHSTSDTDLWRMSNSYRDWFDLRSILLIYFFKICDEKLFSNKYFKKLKNESSDIEIFTELVNKCKNQYPKLSFDMNEFSYNKDKTVIALNTIKNFKITKLELISILQFFEKIILNSKRSFYYNGLKNEYIRFILDLLQIKKNQNILIPLSGLSTSISIILELLKNNNSLENKIKGTDFREDTVLIKILELLIPENFSIADSEHGAFIEKNVYDENDIIITIPPWGIKSVNKVGKFKNASYDELSHYIIKDIISNLREKQKIAVILPPSFLFKNSKNIEKLRNEILEYSKINAIIQMPSNIFSEISVPGILIILETKTRKSDKNIFMSKISEINIINTKSDTNNLEEIVKRYQEFSSNHKLSVQDQKGFLISEDDLHNNTWEVSSRTPEAQSLEKISNKKELNEFSKIISSKPILDNHSGIKLKILRISDIQKNSINTESMKEIFVNEKNLKKYQELFLKKGDVLVSNSGTIGKSVEIKQDYHDIIISPQIFILRPNLKVVNSEFLNQQIRTELIQNQLQSIKTGSVISHLSKKLLEHVIFSIPPLQNQINRIQKIQEIESAISELEKKIAEQKRKLAEFSSNE